ncbi:hypothetical protein GCM10022198_17170 [Klugiella xanthotipulae]
MVGAAGAVVILISGCSVATATPAPEDVTRVTTLLRESADSAAPAGTLSQATDWAWDEVSYFPPYSTAERVRAETGYSHPQVTDSFFLTRGLLVFQQGGETVRAVTLSAEELSGDTRGPDTVPYPGALEVNERGWVQLADVAPQDGR